MDISLVVASDDNRDKSSVSLDPQRAPLANLLTLIDLAPDALWSIDPAYRLVAGNVAFEQRFAAAYQVEVAIGLNLVACLPTELRSQWAIYYGRALRGDRFKVELRDSALAIEVSFHPVLASGQIIGAAMQGRTTISEPDEHQHQRVKADLQQAKDQLQAVLDAVPACVSWFSADLRYLGINRYLASTFKLDAQAVIGQPLGFLDAQSGFSDFVRSFIADAAESGMVEIDTQIDEAPRSFLVVAQKYSQNQAAVFVGLDISDRRRFEAALQESQERYALAMQGANDGLWDWNLKTGKIYFSPRWQQMLGYSNDELSNSPDEWFSRIHTDDRDGFWSQLEAHFAGRTHHFEIEHRMQHRDSSDRWMLSRGLAVRDADGQVYRMAGSQTDITDRKQAEAQLRYDALHDTLTGLANRALFMQRLQALAGRCFAILFLDLDHFKVINDSLGHGLGDQLLVASARRLATCLTPQDTIARWGGDEFAILVAGADCDRATQLAECLHQRLRSPFNLDGHEVFAAASIGITLGNSSSSPEELLRNADTAMYRAKSLGRNRHEVFDAEMHARVVTLLQLETDLRRALSYTPTQLSEFQLHYQPIVSLCTRRIVGFEALVRWQHPDRGLIAPAEFIPLAEDTGLIVPLGQWILGEACRQLRQWKQQFPTCLPLSISVNLSTKQFAQTNLMEQVHQILQQTKITGLAIDLKLEITESALMENPDKATTLLQQLKDLGVKLLIDDFGTGYSSLSYLHRFPFDTVKIDQSFVSGMDRCNDQSEIVRAIVSLAHTLGMNVIAEGVETAAQLAQLQELGAEYGQGYLFAQPLPPEAAEHLLGRMH